MDRARPAPVGSTGSTDTAAAVRELGRAAGRLSDAALAAFDTVPWFAELPPDGRSWVRLVVAREILVMARNLPSPRSPGLRNIFSGVPAEVGRQITFDQTVELIHLTVDVVLDVVGDVLGGSTESLLRADLERYGREVAFAAAAVYAKAAESRGRTAMRRQAMAINALVDGDADQIAAHASEVLSPPAPVRVVGLIPAPGSGAVLVEAVRRAASRDGLPVCVGLHGQYVLVALADRPGPRADPAARLVAGIAGAPVGETAVLSNVADSLVQAAPAVAAVLSALRALPAWLGPTGLVGVDELLAERALCGDSSAARQLVSDCVDPLDAAGRGLVETVDALLRHDGSPAAAAASIPVHVSTLRYRLDRIVALTGRDPRRGRDAFVLRLAFALARTGAAPAGEAGHLGAAGRKRATTS